MTSFKLACNIVRCFCLILAMSALGCSEASSSNDSSADEVSAVPGSACKSRDVESVADLEVTFPGKLNAAEMIVITRWSNADASCPADTTLSVTNLGRLEGVASWENGAVYVRPSEELLVEMGVRVGVVMGCSEARFLGAEVRLDTAGDGRGKLMAKCTREAL